MQISKKLLDAIEALLEKNRQLAMEAAEAAHNASVQGQNGGDGAAGTMSMGEGEEDEETVVVDDERTDL